MLSCNGPTLSEWESTPHVANIPLWCFVAVTENTPLHDCMVFLGPFSRRKEVGTIVLVCQTNCIAWLQAKWYPVFCKVHYQNLFLWFQCSVRELINKPKQSGPIISECFCHPWLITRPPTKNHKGKMCLLYELVKIGRNNSLYCFGSVFIPLSYFVNLFSSRRDFPLKSCRESSGSKSFNKSPSKSFSSARWRPPKSWPCGILISVHFWRSRQWEVDRDGAKARDWIWRGHLAGLHTISSAERFERPGKISLEKRVQNRIHERHCKTNILKRHKRCIG